MLPSLVLLCFTIRLVSAFCGRHTIAARALGDQKFDYGSAGGPLVWHQLSPDFETCKTGTRQAPSNVLTANTPTVKDLKLDIPPVESNAFENIGTTVEVKLNGTLEQGGITRTLKQMHFHTPSEHRIDDKIFVAESHFVMEDDAGAITVMSVLYDLEAAVDTPAISTILASVKDISQPGASAEITKLDFTEFISTFVDGSEFFALDQSLTTPPCTEGVSWFIRKEPVPLDLAAFKDVQSVVKFNSRYTQNQLGQENFLLKSEAAQRINFQAEVVRLSKAISVNETVSDASEIPEGGSHVATAQSAGDNAGKLQELGFGTDFFDNARKKMKKRRVLHLGHRGSKRQ